MSDSLEEHGQKGCQCDGHDGHKATPAELRGEEIDEKGVEGVEKAMERRKSRVVSLFEGSIGIFVEWREEVHMWTKLFLEGSSVSIGVDIYTHGNGDERNDVDQE